MKKEVIYDEPNSKAPLQDMPEAKTLQLVPCPLSIQQKVTEKPVVKSVLKDLNKMMQACKKGQEVDRQEVGDDAKKTKSKKKAARDKRVGKKTKQEEDSQGERTIRKKKPKAVQADEKTSKQKEGKVTGKRRELSCNDGCVYKTRRNQYEAKFSPFS